MSIICFIMHKWNGCICNRCQQVRDSYHTLDNLDDLVQCCRACGKVVCLSQHRWQEGKGICERCGVICDHSSTTTLEVLDYGDPYPGGIDLASMTPSRIPGYRARIGCTVCGSELLDLDPETYHLKDQPRR